VNTLAAVIAIASTTLAIGFYIRERGVDARLKYQDFPHKKWDLENPVSEMRWNSKSEPIYIGESRSLEDSIRRTGRAYSLAGSIFAAIALLAWITAFGY
jgi:hypothetical protein